MPLQEIENYWIQCIHLWYPELNSKTYFLPPLHFNRVPYRVNTLRNNVQVLEPILPLGAVSQTGNKTTNVRKQVSTKHKEKKSLFSFWTRPRVNLPLKPVFDSDVRDDRSLQRVFHSLHALANDRQPKEVMVVVQQLQFGKYLKHPSYAAAIDFIPCPNTLPPNYQDGDFDVLIIHRHYGLFTLEIKSVGDNFNEIQMSWQEEDNAVAKKVDEAVNQLQKAEVVLKYLIADVARLNVTKTLILPNIIPSQLQRAFNKSSATEKNICQCLGVQSVDHAKKLCLLSDRLPDKDSPWDVTPAILESLNEWWQHLIDSSGPHSPMTEDVYNRLVARFCGPATSVEIQCVTPPRLDLRTLGEVVSETGERMALLVLFPDQIALLNASPARVFVCGPPGTGKTVVLILQGMNWLRCGHDVHIVSTWSGSLATTFVIECQLGQTIREFKDSHVYMHQFDFWKSDRVKSAIGNLKSMNKGRQLCVISDEAGPIREHFKQFCERLIKKVPDVCIWGAAVRNDVRPSCLEEVTLTTPLRSPPVVIREVKNAREIQRKDVYDYKFGGITAPTDGPEIRRFKHRPNQSGHTGKWPHDCAECGRQVASLLKELNVNRTDFFKGVPPLNFRDVLVLCFDNPTEVKEDKFGRITSPPCGLVQGLRECKVPVRVVEKGDDNAIRDTARALHDLVTVTNWENIHGLERKIVFVENDETVSDGYDRLYAMSRCSSQLVLMDWNTG